MATATSRKRTTVSVDEFMSDPASFWQRAKAGEEVTVTEGGKVIACIPACPTSDQKMAALVALGIVRPAEEQDRTLPAETIRIEGGAAYLTQVLLEQRGCDHD